MANVSQGNSLLLDHLYSEHLGSWSEIKVKFAPSTIYYKNEKTGKNSHFESKQIRSAEWLYRARGFGLCLKLNNKKRCYFDGFSENECDKVSKYFEDNYGIKVQNVDCSLKGWNWGRSDIDDEYMEFMVDGLRSFDINLKDVINVNLAKNELTLQFQTTDDAFSICEMRFATVSQNEGIMDELYQRVKNEANTLSDQADALVTLREMHCLQPRGRYDIKLCQDFIHLRGKTYDYSVPKEHFVRFYLLPHSDERQIFFVMQVNPPLTHGQTRYYYIILLFNNEDEETIELQCTEEFLKENYKESIPQRMSGLTYEIVTKLFKNLYNQKLTVPNKFESKNKARSINCIYKTMSGFLYPLDKGFIFVPKPCISLRSEEISVVNLSRASVAQRSFDFDIETTNGAVHTFSGIDKSEYNGLMEFIKAKKYVVSSGEANVRREDWSSSDESPDEYLERMKMEGKRHTAKDGKYEQIDDDDDDEEDEDFKPDDSESEVAEEYDSEINTSSGSSSSGSDSSGTKGSKEKPAKTKESIKKHVVKTKVDKSKVSIKSEKTEKPLKEKTSKSGGEGSGKKKIKKIKDPNAPKKPLTAYMLFANEIREDVKSSLSTNSIKDIAKITGERWKALTDAEKTRYADMYKVELTKYQELFKQYQMSGGGSASVSSSSKPSKQSKPSKLSKQSKPEVTGKLSAGIYKSEEFIESSDSSSA